MTPPSLKIQKLAESLIGTCGREDQDVIETLTQEECKQLDHLAFECEQCNWWFSQAERDKSYADGWRCIGCSE